MDNRKTTVSLLDEVLEHSAALHNHLCPRQVLGARMGLYAGALLGLELPQTSKRLYTFVETDGCYADGVAAATGCWLGHRTMRLVDYGKVAATFIDSKSLKAVRIAPSAGVRARAAEEVPDAKSRWHAQLAAYQTLPDDVLLQWEPVALSEPLARIISRPGVRVNCAVCGEEILNEREVVVDGLTLCRSCSGQSYYAVVEAMAAQG